MNIRCLLFGDWRRRSAFVLIHIVLIKRFISSYCIWYDLETADESEAEVTGILDGPESDEEEEEGPGGIVPLLQRPRYLPPEATFIPRPTVFKTIEDTLGKHGYYYCIMAYLFIKFIAFFYFIKQDCRKNLPIWLIVPI